MKILRTIEDSMPSEAATPVPFPAADLGRMDALEKILKNLLQRMQHFENRLDALEVTSKISPVMASVTPSSTSNEPVAGSIPEPAGLAVNTEALRKGLLTKMWKYLQDAS